MSPQPIRTVIVEDDPGYRDSLATMFRYSDGFELVATYTSAIDVVHQVPAAAAAGERWDVVYMDIDLSDEVGGIEAARRVKEAMPDVRVIMLTVFECPTTIMAALCAGADGYVLKRSSARALREHARDVLDGGVPMSREVAKAAVGLVRELGAERCLRAPVSQRRPLSARERDVLRCMADGLTYKEIAAALGIALDTVRTHVRRLYQKLDVHNAREATALALRQGLL